MARVRGRSVSTHHKKATARKTVKVPAHQLTKTPLHLVPGHRRTNCPADHETHPGRLRLASVRPDEQVAHHTGPARTGPGAYGRPELGAVTHPGLGRQDQALSRSRPLCLRAARTARPARVRIRSRKPCVFARRRLFGWNVRLLTEAPGKGILNHARMTTCGSRISHRLPSGTAPFARRAQRPGLRLWKAILSRLPQSQCAAGKPRAQHVDTAVDREPPAYGMGSRGEHRWRILTWQTYGHDPSTGWLTFRSSRTSGRGSSSPGRWGWSRTPP